MSAKTVDEDGCSCVDLVKVYGIVTCWVISISNKGQRSGSCRALIGQVSAKLSSDGSVLFIQNPTARSEESTEHGQEIIPHLNNFVNVHFLFCILGNLHIARKLFSNSFQCSCRNWNQDATRSHKCFFTGCIFNIISNYQRLNHEKSLFSIGISSGAGPQPLVAQSSL